MTYILTILCLLTLPALSAMAATNINVNDFGAKGDCLPLISVNTASNSAIIFANSNTFSPADIGKTIEIFKAGTPTSSTNNQDFIGKITGVDGGTNIGISSVAGKAWTNTLATIGTDNSAAIQSAINSARLNTNTIINFPDSNYLCMAYLKPDIYSSPFSLQIGYGGITFNGPSVLTGQGAWNLTNGNGVRGWLFLVSDAMLTNNQYPVVITNFTLDGGVQVGNTDNHGFPINLTDGSGWDGSHRVLSVQGSGQTLTHITFANVTIQNWRGEALYGGDYSFNGNIKVSSTIFIHNNASAFNVSSFSMDLGNDTVMDTYLGMEYYASYGTNFNLISGVIFSNCTAALAFNGGYLTQPPTLVTNCTFYLTNTPGIETCPADNLFIISNKFLGFGNAIMLGTGGYQPSFLGACDNSNIVIHGNLFNLTGTAVYICGDPSNTNQVESVSVTGNTMTNEVNGVSSPFIYGYGWCSNLVVSGNYGTYLNNSLMTGQWAADMGGNVWSLAWGLSTTATNPSPANYQVGQPGSIGTVGQPWGFYLPNPPAGKLMAGAQYKFYNDSGSQGYTLFVCLGQKFFIPASGAGTFYWNGNNWTIAKEVQLAIPYRVLPP
jgi:hypothetical protein